jgi:hypothetical protein
VTRTFPRPRLNSAVILTVLLAVLAGCGEEQTLTDAPSVQPISAANADADSTPSASDTGTAPGNAAHSSHNVVATVQPPTGTVPRFVTYAATSGFDFERFDHITGQRRIFETTGGGVAACDFDRDGWADLFLTNGCRMPLEDSDRDTPSEFFRGQRGVRFLRSMSRSRISQFSYAQGCAVGDYNSDGFDDLYVTTFRKNSLWRNNGDGTFSDVTDETGTAVPVWSSSAAFGDLNVDGHLDLYVANYLDVDDANPRLCPNPNSPDGYQGCSPALFEGVDDALLLNDGNGGFNDITAAAGIAGQKGKGLGVIISNLDSDLVPEIYVANDGEANFLFVRDAETFDEPGSRESVPSPRYQDLAFASGVALNERGYAQASMGVAVGDYDANGELDLFLTHFYNDTNTLYANLGDLSFTEETRGSRIGPTSRLSLGFGTLFFDADNDGWLDLFVANGHVDDRTWMTPPEPYAMRPQMYRNERDGTFLEVSQFSGPYFEQEWLGRGVASGDFDHDGRVDLVVSHQLSPSVVLQNETETDCESLTLTLVGRAANRNGYGTRVVLEGVSPPVVRELTSGVSYQSAVVPEVHLGLDAASTGTITVRWPSGTVDKHTELKPGRWTLIEGHPAVRTAL